MSEQRRFPPNFLWGSSTSAFQVEGGCSNHDFAEWAKLGRVKDGTRPEDAVDFYHQYPQDIDLMREMNHNAARIGLEWARTQPAADIFDEEAWDHYREVLLCLKAAGIEPVVTLHHFANPLWLVRLGGWENRSIVGLYTRYVLQAMEKLGDLVRYWLTINEPNVYATYAYLQGTFPPGKKNYLTAQRVRKNLIAAHREAYKLIHQYYQDHLEVTPQVSVAMHLRTFDPASGSLLDKWAARFVHRSFHLQFLDPVAGHLDFLGVQYYSGDLVRFPVETLPRPELPKTVLGWDIYPEGFARVVNWAWERYHLPILVTENGVCDEADELRAQFLIDHLEQLHKTIISGVEVIGYLHWSTLDNFELVDGLSRRFGLIHVDHDHPQKLRTIKPSGRLFAEIALKNGLS